MSDNKNLLLAVILSIIVLIGWQYLFAIPQMKEKQARQQAFEQAQQNETGQARSAQSTGATGPQDPDAPMIEGLSPEQPIVYQADTGPRLAIDTPALHGSLALRGLRLDDLLLKNYKEDVDPLSAEITLLHKTGTKNPYYAKFGWVAGNGSTMRLPGPETLWQVKGNGTLTPNSPVTLKYNNDQGLVFQQQISVDDKFMFTFSQSVTNNTGATITLYPYGLISRSGTPQVLGFYFLHEGLIGFVGEQGLQEIDYDDLQDAPVALSEDVGGWIGMTDKYWATVLIPDQQTPYKARFEAQAEGTDFRYKTNFLSDGQTIAPGTTGTTISHLFTGAKKTRLIDNYEETLAIERFELMIDWGWFYFITKPLFWLLEFFHGLLGNFGVAILLATIIIKIIFFPLANKSYAAMARMKKFQPQIAQIRERNKDDKVKQQQEQMELFKREKINPAAGCLPILIQIPVFFALYKVLFITIEMRHAPFFGWIQDLSAPDPTSLFNLFGLIPWSPPQFLMIGIWPLLMGLTMFVQQKMNPQIGDPMQARIMNLLPVFFTFLLASFPAGLVIYWAWNNLLSVIQQGMIMKRNGVPIELFSNLKIIAKKPPTKPND